MRMARSARTRCRLPARAARISNAGYFVDGHFARDLDAPSDARVRLLDAREAGEAFAALLDADLATAGVDFALARINAARGDDVLQIELPGRLAASAHRADVRRPRRPRRTALPIRACRSHAGRNTRLSLVERHLSARRGGFRGQRRVRHLRCAPAPALDHVPRAELRRRAPRCFDTLIAHVAENAPHTGCAP